MKKFKLNFWRESRLLWRTKAPVSKEMQEVQEDLKEVIHHERHGDFESADQAMEAVYRKVSAAGIEINQIAKLKKEQLEALNMEEARGPVNEGIAKLADKYRGRKNKLGMFARYKVAMQSDGGSEKFKNLGLAWKYAKVDDKTFEGIYENILEKEQDLAQKQTALERYQTSCKASEDLMQLHIDRIEKHLDFLKYNPRYWGDVGKLMGKKMGLWWQRKKTAVSERKLEKFVDKSKVKLEKAKGEEAVLKGMVKESIAGAEAHLEGKYVADRQFALEMRDFALSQRAEQQRQLNELEADPHADAGLIKIMHSLIAQSNKEIQKYDTQLEKSERGIDKFLNKGKSRNLALREWLDEHGADDTDEMKEARESRNVAVNRLKGVTNIMKSTGLTSTESAGDVYDYLLSKNEDLPKDWMKLFSEKGYAPILKFLLSGQVGGRRLVLDRTKMLAKTAADFEEILTTPLIFQILNLLATGKSLEQKALAYIQAKDDESTDYDRDGLKGFLNFAAEDSAIVKLVNAKYVEPLSKFGFEKGVIEKYLVDNEADINKLNWSFLENEGNQKWLEFFRHGNSFQGEAIAYSGVDSAKAGIEPMSVTSPEALFELIGMKNFEAALKTIADETDLQMKWTEYLDAVDHNDVSNFSLAAFFEYLSETPGVKTEAGADGEPEAAEINERKEVGSLRQLIKEYGNPHRLDAAQYFSMIERRNGKDFKLTLNWNHLDADLSFLFEDNGFGDPWKVSSIDQMMMILDNRNDEVFEALENGHLTKSLVIRLLRTESGDYTDGQMPAADVFDFLKRMIDEDEETLNEMNARAAISGFVDKRYLVVNDVDQLVAEVNEVIADRGGSWSPAWDNLSFDLSVFFGVMKGFDLNDVVMAPDASDLANFLYLLTDPKYTEYLNKINEADFDVAGFEMFLEAARQSDSSMADDGKFDCFKVLNQVAKYVDEGKEGVDYANNVRKFVAELGPGAERSVALRLLAKLKTENVSSSQFEGLKNGLRKIFALNYVSGRLNAAEWNVWNDLFSNVKKLETVLESLSANEDDEFVMNRFESKVQTMVEGQAMVDFVLDDGPEFINEIVKYKKAIGEAVEAINGQRLEDEIEFDDLVAKIEENDINRVDLEKHTDSLGFLMGLKYTMPSGDDAYLDINDDAVWGVIGDRFDAAMTYLESLTIGYSERQVAIELAELGSMTAEEYVDFIFDEEKLKRKLEDKFSTNQ